MEVLVWLVKTIMAAGQASGVSCYGLSLICSGIMSFPTHPDLVLKAGWVRQKAVNLFPESLQRFPHDQLIIK